MKAIDLLKRYCTEELDWCYQKWWELEAFWYWLEHLKQEEVEPNRMDWEKREPENCTGTHKSWD